MISWLSTGTKNAARPALWLLLAVSLLFAGCASAEKASAKPKLKSPTAKDDQYPETPDEVLQSYAHYAAGLSLDMRDDSTAALDEYLKAAEGNLGAEPLVLEVAGRLLRAKDTDRALELLVKAASHPGSSGLTHSWLGLAYLRAGQTNNAISANRTALQKLPGQITAYVNLCDLYLQLAKTNEVINVLDLAAKQNDAPVEFYAGLADLVLRMQARDVFGPDESRKRATNALDKASAMNPQDPILRQRMGDAYLFHGANDKAQVIYEKLYAELPGLPGIREKLINVYFRTNKEKAAEMLNNLRKESPTDPRPHMFLGQLALDDNRIEDGLDHFETALKLNPADESLWYRVAALKVALKKPAEALDLLNKAKGRFRLGFAQEFYTGLALSAMERYKEALSKFVSAELLAKNSEPDRLTAQFYFQLGSASERAKDIEQSVKYFRRALELEPDFSEALNYLGYMWAERGENLEEAGSMIERALKAEPKNAAFLDSMAWVLFKQNKPAAALPYIEKAIQYNEKEDATLFDHLGDILAALKRLPEAREAWEKALKLEPKEEIRRKIEAGA